MANEKLSKTGDAPCCISIGIDGGWIPVKVKKLSPRMEKVISLSDAWTENNDGFPEKIRAISNGVFTPKGEYVAEGTNIIFINGAGIKKIVAEGFSIVISEFLVMT